MELTAIEASLWRQIEEARREIGNLKRRNEQLRDALNEIHDAVDALDAPTVDTPTVDGRLVGFIAPLSADWGRAA